MLFAPASRLRVMHAATAWQDELRAALGDDGCVVDVGGGNTSGWLLRRAGLEVAPLSRCATPYALPLADAGCDALLACHVVPRLARPHDALAEWLRVLRPGGRLAILELPVAARRAPWWRRLRVTRRGPFASGLRPWEARLLLELADLRDIREHRPVGPFYLISGQTG